MPESSAIAGRPVAACAARALSSAFSLNVTASSGGSPTSGGSGSSCTPGRSSRSSRSLCSFRVATTRAIAARMSGGQRPERRLLRLPQRCDATLGQGEKLIQRRPRERGALRGRLHLHEAAVARHDHVGVDLRPRVLGVVEIAQRLPIDHPDADRRYRLVQRQPLDRFTVDQYGQGLLQGHEATGDRRAARPAVRLQHVAVHVDRSLTERLEVDHAAEGTADQALDLHPASILLAAADVARLAIPGGRRQHRVLGGDPAPTPALHPPRHGVAHRGGADDARLPLGDARRAVRGADEAGLDRRRPDVGGGAVVAAAGGHGASLARSPPAPRPGRARAAAARYLNFTWPTASRILSTIVCASSRPCLPWNPFMAATMPTISRATSRIRPTYSTVPWPRRCGRAKRRPLAD